MWNTFERLRGSLEKQYLHPDFDPASGSDPVRLQSEMESYYAQNISRPFILVRAELMDLLFQHCRIAIDPEDWFADHLEGRDLILSLQKRKLQEAREALPPEARSTVINYIKTGTFVPALDLSHTSPDWSDILLLGPSGLRDRAEKALQTAKDEEAVLFYKAAALVFEAMRKLIIRFASLAEKRNAVQQMTALRAIAERPPETLQEALQLALIYDTCQEIEGEPVRSQGLFDRQFIRFYRHDIEHEILTREQAKELLKFFWTKFYAQMHPNGKNICFGGLSAPGVDACNELTALCFEIHRELDRINPKLSFRVHKNTPDDILLQVTDCVRSGRTAIVFNNEELAFEMFRRRGKEEKDLYNYVLIGCYEPAIMGREMCCSMMAWGNFVKPLEAVFNNGCSFDGIRIGPECSLPSDYSELEKEYLRQLDHVLISAMEAAKAFERQWPQTNPSPLLSGTMEACIQSGRDVSNGGTRYNSSGVMCGGIGTATDSLAAVRFLVEERKLCTIEQLADALKKNWKGYENLRLIAQKKAPKFGCGIPEADDIARRIFDAAVKRINSTPNTRGGYFQMGLWSIDHNFTFGKTIAATPDGRLAGDPLSRNAGGSIGMEKNGVTALMRSVASLDLAECPDGSVLDVMLHPSTVSGSDGAGVIAGLIRSFFAAGGLTVQFNILNADDLKKAQKDPEKYSDVQVRVCGWNNKFVNLSLEEQNAFIAQAEVRQ